MGATLKKGQNDLLTVMPDLAKEWHFKKNGKLTPADVCVMSSRNVWWVITEIRFGKTFVLEWQSTVANRANGCGCPYTSKPPKRLMKGFNDMASTNPALAALWHPKKNGSVYPDMIFEFTNRKHWWFHQTQKNGKIFFHEWQAVPSSVTLGSCPICHGSKVMCGFNDLVTTHPNIAGQWNPSNDISIYEVTAGSNKKVGWICNDCGNRWEATINNRTSGSGCPKCAFRYSTSFSEQAILYYLLKQFPFCINRDIKVLNGLELDIYLSNEKIAIEYNGLWSHHSTEKQMVDQRKQQMCNEKGILLINICEHKTINQHYPSSHLIYCKENKDYFHLNFVMECISKELILAGYLQQPIEINITLDHQDIRAQYAQTVKERSLASKFPNLLPEWDYVKNKNLSPEAVFAYGNTKVYWQHKVIKGGKEFIHSWMSSVVNRTSKGNNCPICAGKKVLPGFNDLKTADPSFINEWDYEKNDSITPCGITCNSGRKIWWKHVVVVNGKAQTHSWQATVSSRSRGNGCPICDKKIIVAGFNDLATTYSNLLAEWDYEKNKIKPTDISYGYDKKVWWKHTAIKENIEYSHSWQASPNSRTNKKSNCPYCANKKVMTGYNDLATIHPEAAQKWDNTKNGNLTPQNVSAASNKRVWWIDRKRPIKIADRVKYIRKTCKTTPK